MSGKELSASQAGEISLGNEISVHRQGYGAMRRTGEGVWGPPTDRKAALATVYRAMLPRLRESSNAASSTCRAASARSRITQHPALPTVRFSARSTLRPRRHRATASFLISQLSPLASLSLNSFSPSPF